MEKIQKKNPVAADSELEQTQRFENEGGASSGSKSAKLSSKLDNEIPNLWCRTVSNFQRLKNYGAPIAANVTALWKGSRAEYAILKKSFGAAQVAYRTEKKEVNNRK